MAEIENLPNFFLLRLDRAVGLLYGPHSADLPERAKKLANKAMYSAYQDCRDLGIEPETLSQRMTEVRVDAAVQGVLQEPQKPKPKTSYYRKLLLEGTPPSDRFIPPVSGLGKRSIYLMRYLLPEDTSGVYIRNGHSTGEIARVSKQLLLSADKLLEVGKTRIIGLDPSSPKTPSKIKEALDANHFPKKDQAAWEDIERTSLQLMAEVGTPLDPQQLDYKIAEFLQPKADFTTPREVIRFFGSIHEVLKELMDINTRTSIGSIATVQRAIAHTRVLKRGFYKGEWMTRPTPNILDPELDQLLSLPKVPQSV